VFGFSVSELRMSNDPSLTDAVREAAGISLTRAVKEAAGRSWCVEDVRDAGDAAAPGILARLARGMFVACARMPMVALLALAVLHFTPTAVHDQERSAGAVTPRRVALVIGNSAYRYTPRLENPKNDGADIGAALRKIGFQVIEGFDLGKVAFDAKILEFAEALKGADVGLFFYAGHGIQVSGQNYLVPIDAKLTTASALDAEMVRLDRVHRTMEQEARTSLLFLDACRDNPLARNLARTLGAPSPDIGQGLAAVESGAGTLISFSTQPGNVALDGAGRNSPFSGALVRHLGTSNEDLNAVLIAVRNEVMRQTDRRQVPWEHSALTRRFYFNATAQVTANAPAAQLRLSEAADAWNATKESSSLALLDAFAARYSDTFFAELARARIDELKSASAPSRASALEQDAAGTFAR
jgi:uncharacterized caspase-like protein